MAISNGPVLGPRPKSVAPAPPSVPTRVARAVRYEATNLTHPMRIDATFAGPVPAPRTELKIASYNVELGGLHPAQVARDLAKLNPDVICLQETSLATTRLVAKQLGMYYAFYDNGSPTVGSLKAVLSRYPIVAAENKPYKGLFWERIGAFVRGLLEDHKPYGEMLESRSVLATTIQVGSRKVNVLDTHLSLYDTRSNAKEILQLTQDALASARTGRPVLVAGDFNAHMGLASPGTADPAGTLATATDTLAEYHDRYHNNAGNMEDAGDRHAAQGLFTALNGYWTAPVHTLTLNNQPITPEQAQAELASGKAAPGSARYNQLLMVQDGISHLAAHKRFDNILASKDVTLESAQIDQDTRASDHQPVSAVVKLNQSP